MMSEEQNTDPTEKPYLVIETATLLCIEKAENIADNLASIPDDMYAGDTAVLTYGVLQAQNATNQLLVTLFSSINEGFQGFDLLMSEIMNAMGIPSNS